MDKDKNKQKSDERAVRDYRGVDIDIADDDKVTPCSVKQEIHMMNDNPNNASSSKGQ